MTAGGDKDEDRRDEGVGNIATLAAPSAPGAPGAELTDEALVAATRAGDDLAFERLYRRYQRRISAYVMGMVHDHGRAEDITQEVFMSALRRMRETERPIAFKPWIYEIAKNACIDAFRRTRRAELVSYDADEDLGGSDQGRLVSNGPTPDAVVDTRMSLDHLCGAFGGLSDTHHDILVMRELEGLSYREIGERLGMSRPSVESTLFRARRRLTEEYEELASGERCRRIQTLIGSGSASLRARDGRRMARHISHCQPCRRAAFAAGVDVAALAQRAPVRAKIAALLPLPALLRRRWLEGADGGSVLGAPGPGASLSHWSAAASQYAEPAAGWTKAAAVAAIAATGVGAGVATTHQVANVRHARAVAAQSAPAVRSAAPLRARPPVGSGVAAAAMPAARRAGTSGTVSVPASPSARGHGFAGDRAGAPAHGPSHKHASGPASAAAPAPAGGTTTSTSTGPTAGPRPSGTAATSSTDSAPGATTTSSSTAAPDATADSAVDPTAKKARAAARKLRREAREGGADDTAPGTPGTTAPKPRRDNSGRDNSGSDKSGRDNSGRTQRDAAAPSGTGDGGHKVRTPKVKVPEAAAPAVDPPKTRGPRDGSRGRGDTGESGGGRGGGDRGSTPGGRSDGGETGTSGATGTTGSGAPGTVTGSADTVTGATSTPAATVTAPDSGPTATVGSTTGTDASGG